MAKLSSTPNLLNTLCEKEMHALPVGVRKRFVSTISSCVSLMVLQRCDSARPTCTTCKGAGREQECEYQHDSHGGALRWVNKSKSTATDNTASYELSPSSGDTTSRVEEATYSPSSSADSPLTQGSSLTREPSVIPTSDSYYSTSSLSSASSPGSNDPLYTMTALDFPITSQLYNIDEDPWATALSDVSPGDMNMDLYVLHLYRRHYEVPNLLLAASYSSLIGSNSAFISRWRNKRPFFSVT